MPKIADRPKRMIKKTKPPVWKGPEEDGVTQSMLNGFLSCRERFRLKVVEGLQETDTFRKALEFGNMWHLCEETYGATGSFDETHADLLAYCGQLASRYPTSQVDIDKWYRVCKLQFVEYLKYWDAHPMQGKVESILQEEVFCLPYDLPSGRTVKLKGKWDEIIKVGNSTYLKENKTKGDIREEQIKNQLHFDKQTGIYMVAMEIAGYKPQGVLYNVVRRPLSGGRGSIRPHKETKNKPAETMEAYYERLRVIIEEEPEHYFMRWQVEIGKHDLANFQKRFLNPILEQLCDWWHWVSSTEGRIDPFQESLHWQTPYGGYNSLADGGTTDLDEYLKTGSKVGLQRVETLFPELN